MESIVPRRQNRAKCSYRPKLDCPRLTTHSHTTRLFPAIWTQNVVCTSSDMVAMWLVWIPPSLRSGGYTSHSSQSPPCRPGYTIYYYGAWFFNFKSFPYYSFFLYRTEKILEFFKSLRVTFRGELCTYLFLFLWNRTFYHNLYLYFFFKSQSMKILIFA